MARVAPLARPPAELRRGTGWRARWLGLRDRWLASPELQRFAARFPPTRFVARRRARSLFDLCAGFVYSQVLLACVRLGVFEALRAGPVPAAALGNQLRVPAEPMRCLLEAAVALDLVERRGDVGYGLGVHGAALLGNAAVVAMIEHHALLYADLADPVALLRGDRSATALGRYWAYANAPADVALPPAEIAAYTELMSSSQPLVAHCVLDAYALRGHRAVLDVGGGDGTFLQALAARAPHVRCLLFDLPPVAARARERFVAAGLATRADAVGGDFRTQPLPCGADLITFVRVLHDHDDSTVRGLLRAAHDALPAGGRVLIAEPMAATPGAEPMGAAYFGMYLLAMGQGRPRTAGELEGLLVEAGFSGVRRVSTAQPLQASLLIADRISVAR